MRLHEFIFVTGVAVILAAYHEWVSLGAFAVGIFAGLLIGGSWAIRIIREQVLLEKERDTMDEWKKSSRASHGD